MNYVRTKPSRWLWNISGKRKYSILALLTVQIILSACAVGSAKVMQLLVDSAVAGNRNGFIHFAILFGSIILLQIILRAVNRRMEEATKSDLENRTKQRLFDTLLEKDFASVTETHSGEWMNRFTSDTVVVADGMTSILPGAAGMLLKLAGAVALILLMIPKAAMLIAAGGAGMILLTFLFRRTLKRLHRDVQEADGRVRVYAQERIEHFLIVHAFVREREVSAELGENMGEHRKIRLVRNRFSNICNAGFGLAIQGAYFLGAIYCGSGILNGTMSFGTFTAILQLVAMIQSPFANLSGYLPRYYSMIASAERLMEAEQMPAAFLVPLLSAEQIRRLYDERLQEIRLEDLRFSYPDSVDVSESMKVLEHFSCRIPKGSFTAITGASGSGKSTLFKVLMGLYPLEDGTRTLMLSEGEQLELDHNHQRLFAYVPQGNHLMSGSIRDGVMFQKSSPSEDDRVWNALRIACAEDFVRELPLGLDTQLMERGGGLSEGQMQRIAIARALYTDSPVLLLDEATSALDEETERRLLENLHRMTDRTVLIVTHRPAALEFCDRQIKMDD